MRARVGLIGLVALAITLFVTVLLSVPELAHACGGFFSRHARPVERRPSLAYEQTLIVFDGEKHREHFVREVVFRASDEKFGFVVPTPARPEVAKVAKSPFSELRNHFPFESGIGLVAVGTGAGGPGQGFGKGRGVTVLEVSKVGSFTAFVLAADDSKALADWLAKNQLATTPEAEAWLEHYVRMKFFYVAMRYDPPAGDAAQSMRMKAETVRISFDTPLAYYPYFEPNPPAGVVANEPRMLEIWLVSRTRTSPIAARKEGDAVKWVRPFAEGQRFEHAARESLEKALGSDKSLLFEGDVWVQRFIDQKRSRVGFSDVLFAPIEKTKTTQADRERLLALAPILDPSLEPEAPGKAAK